MTERLDTELLITAGVKGLSHLDKLIAAIQKAGGNTDQLREEYEQLQAEWDSLSTDQQAKRLHNLGKAANASAADVGLLGKRAKKTATSFDQLRGMAFKLAAALGAVWAVNKARDFFATSISGAAALEEQLAKVQGVSGASAEEMAKIKAKAEELGATTRYTARQSAEGFEILARAGLNAEQQIAAIPSVLAVAQGESIAMADAAKYIGDAVVIMGDSFDQAGKYANILSKGASQAATDVPELANAIAYAGGYAKSANLDFADLVGVLDVLANNGIRGERAGTGLRNVFAQLQNPTSAAAQALRELNIDVTDFYGVIDGIAAAGARGQAAINAFGTEAGPTLMALLSSGSEGAKAFTAAIDAASDTAIKKAATMDDTFAGAFAGLQSAWTGLKNTLGEPFLDVVSDKFRSLSEIIRDLTRSGRITELGQQLADTFGKAADKVLAFVKALDFEKGLDKVSKAFAHFTDAVTKLNGVFNTLRATFAVIKLGFYGIGFAASSVVTVVAAALEKLLGFGEAVTSVFGDNVISRQFDTLRQSLATLKDDLAQNTIDIANEMKRTVDVVAGNVTAMADATVSAVDKINQQFSAVGVNASTTADGIAEATNRILESTTDPAAFQAMRLELTALKEAGRLNAEQYEALLSSIDTSEVVAAGIREAREAMQQTLTDLGISAKSTVEEVNQAVSQIISSGADRTALQALQFLLKEMGNTGKLTNEVITQLHIATTEAAQAAVAAGQKESDAEKAKQAEIRKTAELRDQAAQSAREAFDRIGIDLDGINSGVSSKNKQMIRDLITGLEQAKAAGQDTGKVVGEAFEAMVGKLNSKEEFAEFNRALEETGSIAELTAEQLKYLKDGIKGGAEAAKEAANVTQRSSRALLDEIRQKRAAARQARQNTKATKAQQKATEDNADATEKASEQIMQSLGGTAQSYNQATDAVRETGQAAQDSARDMSSLANSAKDAADSIAASLAGIRGDTAQQAQIQQEQKLRALRERLKEAEKEGNGEAIRQYRRAINLQKQLFLEQQKKAQATAKPAAEPSPTKPQSDQQTSISGKDVAAAWKDQLAEAERRGAERAKQELAKELIDAGKRKAV